MLALWIRKVKIDGIIVLITVRNNPERIGRLRNQSGVEDSLLIKDSRISNLF